MRAPRPTSSRAHRRTTTRRLGTPISIRTPDCARPRQNSPTAGTTSTTLPGVGGDGSRPTLSTTTVGADQPPHRLCRRCRRRDGGAAVARVSQGVPGDVCRCPSPRGPHYTGARFGRWSPHTSWCIAKEPTWFDARFEVVTLCGCKPTWQAARGLIEQANLRGRGFVVRVLTSGAPTGLGLFRSCYVPSCPLPVAVCRRFHRWGNGNDRDRWLPRRPVRSSQETR